ncbi:MAG: 16S rRNA (guanine(527)-N(7))-methyltransferase RsmG [Anaerocolumna sp.]
MKDKAAFISLLKGLNITLSEFQIEQFLKYYELLVEKNKIMNLTAITEYKEVLSKHFIDSLSLIKIYDINQNINVLDMGTGAGFPGIPLKIAFPKINVVLLDSLNKRVNFLNEVISVLDLDNILAVHGRAEDFGKKEGYREGFDLCVSRAVAKLSILSEYCLPYVKVKGYFISYKAGNIQNELAESKKAIEILGGQLAQVESFELPGTNIERSLIKINKIRNTSVIYPRNAGKPVKEPIQ